MGEFGPRPKPWHPGDDDLIEKSNSNYAEPGSAARPYPSHEGDDELMQPPNSNPAPKHYPTAKPYPSHRGDEELWS